MDTEISPELVPFGLDGEAQSTQPKVGPYQLQDLNLYYIVRNGMCPSKVVFISWQAGKVAAQGTSVCRYFAWLRAASIAARIGSSPSFGTL